MKFLFQLRPRVGDLSEEFFVFRQEVVHVAGAFVGIVRVLEVEVEVSCLDGVDGDAPGAFVFLALAEVAVFVGFAPPRLFRLELGDADGLALVVTLGAGRIGVLVIPDVLGGRALGEEEQVGADAWPCASNAILVGNNFSRTG